jgi:hypothetical protein
MSGIRRHTTGGSGYGADVNPKENILTIHCYPLNARLPHGKGTDDRVEQGSFVMNIASEPRSHESEHDYTAMAVEDLSVTALQKDAKGRLAYIRTGGFNIGGPDPIPRKSDARVTQIMTLCLQGEQPHVRNYEQFLAISPGEDTVFVEAWNLEGFIADPDGAQFKDLVTGDAADKMTKLAKYSTVHSVGLFVASTGLPIANLDTDEPKTWIPIYNEIRRKLERMFPRNGWTSGDPSKMTKRQKEHKEWVNLVGSTEEKDKEALQEWTKEGKFHFNAATTLLRVTRAGRSIEMFLNHAATSTLVELTRPTAARNNATANANANTGFHKVDARPMSMWCSLVPAPKGFEDGTHWFQFVTSGQTSQYSPTLHGGLVPVVAEAPVRAPSGPKLLEDDKTSTGGPRNVYREKEEDDKTDAERIILYKPRKQGLPPAEWFGWTVPAVALSLDKISNETVKKEVKNWTETLKFLYANANTGNYQFLIARVVAMGTHILAGKEVFEKYAKQVVEGLSPEDAKVVRDAAGDKYLPAVAQLLQRTVTNFATEFLVVLDLIRSQAVGGKRDEGGKELVQKMVKEEEKGDEEVAKMDEGEDEDEGDEDMPAEMKTHVFKKVVLDRNEQVKASDAAFEKTRKPLVDAYGSVYKQLFDLNAFAPGKLGIEDAFTVSKAWTDVYNTVRDDLFSMWVAYGDFKNETVETARATMRGKLLDAVKTLETGKAKLIKAREAFDAEMAKLQKGLADLKEAMKKDGDKTPAEWFRVPEDKVSDADWKAFIDKFKTVVLADPSRNQIVANDSSGTPISTSIADVLFKDVSIDSFADPSDKTHYRVDPRSVLYQGIAWPSGKPDVADVKAITDYAKSFPKGDGRRLYLARVAALLSGTGKFAFAPSYDDPFTMFTKDGTQVSGFFPST